MLARLLAIPVAAYIRRQRNRLNEQATPIPETAKLAMAPYFPIDLLNRVRILERDPLPIPNLPFTNLIRTIGLDYPNLSLTAAITLDHLIVTRAQMPLNLLFHELVHVVQYRQLGVPKFARLYVRGLLIHRAYEKIPLEACAFELESRHKRAVKNLNVESEVAAWIAKDRF